MQKGKVKLTRKHSGGLVKIHDRMVAMGDDKKPLTDKAGEKVIVPFYHRLSRDAVGKPFEVNDIEFVLKKHGSILKKA